MLKHPRFHLALTIWLMAMAGVVTVALTVLPPLVAKAHAKLPLSAIIALTLLQSGIMVALAVWAGVTMGKAVGLRAPAVEAALAGQPAWPHLRAQLLPAALVAIAAAAVLLIGHYVAPSALQQAGQQFQIPALAKVLYGGITEEVLMRFGLMSVMLWLPWRWMQKRQNSPRLVYVMGAILVSAMLFGALHLPAAGAMGIPLSASVITFIVLGNALPAMLFGGLYWRYGLEAAMIAHALAHIGGIVAGAI
jgi:hypothetical protein